MYHRNQQVLPRLPRNTSRFTRALKAAAITASFAASIGFSSMAAAAASCDNCTVVNSVNTQTQVISAKTKEIVDVIMEAAYAVDKWVASKVMPSNDSLLKSSKDTDAATRNSSANLISYYLAGMETKEKEEISLARTSQAEDDSGSSPRDANEYARNIFERPTTPTSAATTTPTATSDNVNAINAAINADTLLGSRQYNTEQQKNAQLVLRYIELSSPLPDIIRVSKKFVIPLSTTLSGASAEKTEVTFSNNEVKDLVNDLKTNRDYIKYKLNYRALLAMRTMLMNNLLHSYQSRIAPSAKEKSAAELDYESATWRLNPTEKISLSSSPSAEKMSYADHMKQQASPAVVNREILLLLAEMRYDLYQIRQQNEQLIALQSIAGLKSLQEMSRYNVTNTSSKISEYIYCWRGKNPDTDICKKYKDNANTSTSSSSTAKESSTKAADLMKVSSIAR